MQELNNCRKSLSYRAKKSINIGVLGPRSPSRSSKGLSSWSRSPRGETQPSSKILCEAGRVGEEIPWLLSSFSLPFSLQGFPGLEPKWRPTGLGPGQHNPLGQASRNARDGAEGKAEIHHHDVQDTIQGVTQC